MSRGWAVRMSRLAVLSSGALRLDGDVEVLELDSDLWLRGPRSTAALDLSLRKIPGARRYEMAERGQVIPCDQLLPTLVLPEEGWRPLSRWLTLDAQPPLAPAAAHRRVRLTLVPSGLVEEPGVLVTTLEAWAAYATTAPAIRLSPLIFAVSPTGSAVIRGRPLPPMPGQLYTEAAGIAVPCGLKWEPALDAAVVCEVFGVAPGGLALLGPTGHDLVRPEVWVSATRIAVRQTLREHRARQG